MGFGTAAQEGQKSCDFSALSLKTPGPPHYMDISRAVKKIVQCTAQHIAQHIVPYIAQHIVPYIVQFIVTMSR